MSTHTHTHGQMPPRDKDTDDILYGKVSWYGSQRQEMIYFFVCLFFFLSFLSRTIVQTKFKLLNKYIYCQIDGRRPLRSTRHTNQQFVPFEPSTSSAANICKDTCHHKSQSARAQSIRASGLQIAFLVVIIWRFITEIQVV